MVILHAFCMTLNCYLNIHFGKGILIVGLVNTLKLPMTNV